MKTFHYILLLLIVLPVSSVSAKEIVAINKLTEFNEFTENYYRTPRPDLVESALHYFTSSDLIKHRKVAIPIFMTFSCIISNSTEINREKWIKTLPDIDKSYHLILGALFEYPPEKFLNEAAIDDSLRIDMNWACFFASGKTKYLKNIIDRLKYLKNEDPLLYIIGASAKSSLSSNARKHKLVRNVIENIQLTETTELKKSQKK